MYTILAASTKAPASRHQSHLTWEWMLSIPFHIEDKSQMKVASPNSADQNIISPSRMILWAPQQLFNLSIILRFFGFKICSCAECMVEIWYSAAKHLQGNGVIACILNVTLLLKVKWWQKDITYHCQRWQLSEKHTSSPPCTLFPTA